MDSYLGRHDLTKDEKKIDKIKRIIADFYVKNNVVVSQQNLIADTSTDDSDYDCEWGEDEVINVAPDKDESSSKSDGEIATVFTNRVTRSRTEGFHTSNRKITMFTDIKKVCLQLSDEVAINGAKRLEWGAAIVIKKCFGGALKILPQSFVGFCDSF